MAEIKAFNVYQKLQKCRTELAKMNIKKSGQNTYSKYNYYELGDFLPALNELMDKHNLTAIFGFSADEAKLTVINTEETSEQILFSTPISIAELKGTYAIQNLGATQTYARRYLYVMAFEIAEGDVLDEKKGEHDEQLIRNGQKISVVKIETIKALLDKTGRDIASLLKYYKLKKLEDMTNGLFDEVVKMLNDNLEKQERDAKAAKAQAKQETIPDLGM